MGPEWFIVIGVVVLLFGGSQLPKLARSLGQAQNEFKKGVTDGSGPSEDDTPTPPSAANVAPTTNESDTPKS
jgi:sec-independent protein translocase protein TatA